MKNILLAVLLLITPLLKAQISLNQERWIVDSMPLPYTSIEFTIQFWSGDLNYQDPYTDTVDWTLLNMSPEELLAKVQQPGTTQHEVRRFRNIALILGEDSLAMAASQWLYNYHQTKIQEHPTSTEYYTAYIHFLEEDRFYRNPAAAESLLNDLFSKYPQDENVLAYIAGKYLKNADLEGYKKWSELAVQHSAKPHKYYVNFLAIRQLKLMQEASKAGNGFSNVYLNAPEARFDTLLSGASETHQKMLFYADFLMKTWIVYEYSVLSGEGTPTLDEAKLSEAEAFMNKLIDSKPASSIFAHKCLYYIYLMRGNRTLAEEKLNYLLYTLKYSDPVSLLKLFTLQYAIEEKLKEMLPYLEKATKISLDSKDLAVEGRAYIKLKDYEKALQPFLMAFRASENSISYLENPYAAAILAKNQTLMKQIQSMIIGQESLSDYLKLYIAVTMAIEGNKAGALQWIEKIQEKEILEQLPSFKAVFNLGN